jgi:hypothetical protein
MTLGSTASMRALNAFIWHSPRVDLSLARGAAGACEERVWIERKCMYCNVVKKIKI